MSAHNPCEPVTHVEGAFADAATEDASVHLMLHSCRYIIRDLTLEGSDSGLSACQQPMVASGPVADDCQGQEIWVAEDWAPTTEQRLQDHSN